MYYIVSIKNINTGEIAALKVFSPLAVGGVIGWGTDDGENIAQWVVEYCSLRTPSA